MSRPPRAKAWYDQTAAESVRVVSRQGPALHGPLRGRRPRVAPGLLECLAYPFVDGPGVVLIVLWPPILFLLSLPVFDVIALMEPLSRGNFALGLLVLPVFMPLLLTFAMVVGYSLLILGQMLVASALGQSDHPNWPAWDSAAIAEGLGRWLWATVFGVVVGGMPVAAYWVVCGDIDWFDRVVFADLVIGGAGFALGTLAASLLNDSVLKANPITVLAAAAAIGWDLVLPCVLGGLALMAGSGLFYALTTRIASFKLATLALWGFWVFTLYAGMAVLRAVGLTYHAHAEDLAWFGERPRWGLPKKVGRIYSNS